METLGSLGMYKITYSPLSPTSFVGSEAPLSWPRPDVIHEVSRRPVLWSWAALSPWALPSACILSLP